MGRQMCPGRPFCCTIRILWAWCPIVKLPYPQPKGDNVRPFKIWPFRRLKWRLDPFSSHFWSFLVVFGHFKPPDHQILTQNPILTLGDPTSTGRGAPWPKLRYAFGCSVRGSRFAPLRSVPLARCACLAPLCSAPTLGPRTAQPQKLRLTLASSAVPCGLRRLNGYTPPNLITMVASKSWWHFSPQRAQWKPCFSIFHLVVVVWLKIGKAQGTWLGHFWFRVHTRSVTLPIF